MVCTVEVQRQRFGSIPAILTPAEITCLHHLREHHIASVACTVRIAYRIEERRVLAQSYQGSRLAERQVLRLLIKIGISRRLDTHGIMQEIEVVEIEGDNLLLGIVSLQPDGNHPLYRFLQQSLQRTPCLLGIELLGKLLGDGTATAGIGLSQDSTLDDGTSQGTVVDTRMLIETGILGSHQRLY